MNNCANNSQQPSFPSSQESQINPFLAWDATPSNMTGIENTSLVPAMANNSSAAPTAIPGTNAANSAMQWTNHPVNNQGLTIAASRSLQNAFATGNFNDPLLFQPFTQLEVSARRRPAREYSDFINRGMLFDPRSQTTIQCPMRLGLTNMFYYSAQDSLSAESTIQAVDNTVPASGIAATLFGGNGSSFSSDDFSQSASASQSTQTDSLLPLLLPSPENMPCAICGATNDFLCSFIHLPAQAEARNVETPLSLSLETDAFPTPETISPILASGAIPGSAARRLHMAARPNAASRRRVRARRRAAQRDSANHSFSAEAAGMHALRAARGAVREFSAETRRELDDILNAIRDNPYPDKDMIDFICVRLNLSEKQVRNWFALQRCRRMVCTMVDGVAYWRFRNELG
ncbi:hypothetical protein H4R99_007181 [Coemansia sp. RSA 1722]|nr:hypothetical protein H4R99_007181 [Coemansia sp. RSA 1722]